MMDYIMAYFGLPLMTMAVLLLLSMFRVLREYERGVIFMLGRFPRKQGRY